MRYVVKLTIHDGDEHYVEVSDFSSDRSGRAWVEGKRLRHPGQLVTWEGWWTPTSPRGFIIEPKAKP